MSACGVVFLTSYSGGRKGNKQISISEWVVTQKAQNNSLVMCMLFSIRVFILKAGKTLWVSCCHLTNCHQCCGFERQIFRKLEFWRSEFHWAKIEGWAGLCFFLGLKERTCFLSFPASTGFRVPRLLAPPCPRRQQWPLCLFSTASLWPSTPFLLPYSQQSVFVIKYGPTQINQNIFPPS